jgi:hypothetical protein
VSGGYTPAARFVVEAGAKSAFVKAATTPVTAAMLRREARVYERLDGPFMPRFIGWEDDEAAPILVIEDLGEAQWPPPWTPGRVESVLAGLEDLHARRCGLATVHEVRRPSDFKGWTLVARDPGPFLALGMAPAAWLEQALPALLDAEARCVAEGSTAAHFDLRSDNICFTPDGPKFIDWAAASLGDSRLDLGFWLPSLAFEGGPQPEAILAEAPDVAACVCGYFAARAGLPPIPDAPFVRRVQREQLTTALPWACRALGLAPAQP